jgi:hypothetical protein
MKDIPKSVQNKTRSMPVHKARKMATTDKVKVIICLTFIAVLVTAIVLFGRP